MEFILGKRNDVIVFNLSLVLMFMKVNLIVKKEVAKKMYWGFWLLAV